MTRRPPFTWRLRTRTLKLGERTLLMGIVNVTPDSFFDGGKYLDPHAALTQALRLLDEGADLLDLGGESTRPASRPVSAEEEQMRLLPVLRLALRVRPDVIVSVDTYHASTAQAALDAGAEIINDVSGLLWDPQMAGILAQGRPGAVLMHTRGRPSEWPSLPRLAAGEVMPLVFQGLSEALRRAEKAGIPRDTIAVDPGFGFGKLGEENFDLLAHLGDLRRLGCPILAGTSRKRFLTGRIARAADAQREAATSASHVASVLAGAHLLRVHDVAAALAAASVGDALLAATPE